MERKFGALSSSVDPQKLSATVSGLIKALGGLLVLGGISSVEINELAEGAGTLVTLAFTFYGVAETTFGVLRKIVVKLTENFG